MGSENDSANERGDTPSKSEIRDTPGVVAPPPVIQVGSILIGIMLHLAWPHSLPFVASIAWIAVPAVLGLALLIVGLSFREFLRHHTSVRPDRPSSSLIVTGPYRYSRNPLYLAAALLHFGLALWVNSLAILVMLIPTLIIMSFGVIAREERYLERTFGQEYVDYKRSVRRWL